MTQTVTIERRFRGPPESANGGYACGTVAGLLNPGGGSIAATLRVPPPLDHPLRPVVENGDARLLDGETVVAEAELEPALELELPAPVAFDEAVDAGRTCPWADEHFYPMCFACGPDRSPPDGLHNLLGPVEGRELMADGWVPDASLANRDGIVDPRVVWAALDCPSGHGCLYFHPADGPVLLGRLTAQLWTDVRAGERYVVHGWPVGRDGRKHLGGSALFDDSGEPVAVALGLWIELRG